MMNTNSGDLLLNKHRELLRTVKREIKRTFSSWNFNQGKVTSQMCKAKETLLPMHYF